MASLKIPQEFLKIIYAEAEREHPHECCGMVLGPEEDPTLLSRVRPCRNVQNEYHARDPISFPRTAETAYFIAPAELLMIQKETRENRESIRIIYHSHTHAGAYFSEEDLRVAAPEGEPAYPGVNYLVLSVLHRRVKEINLFHWDPKVRKFVL